MTFSGGMKMGQGHGVSGSHPQSAKEVHACTVGLEPGLAKDGSQGSPPSFKSMAFSTTSRAAGIAVEGGWCSVAGTQHLYPSMSCQSQQTEEKPQPSGSLSAEPIPKCMYHERALLFDRPLN